MGQFLVFHMPAVAINHQSPGFIPDDPMTLLIDIFMLIWIFLEDPHSNCAYAHGIAWLVVPRFINVIINRESYGKTA
jgi:hypothetical protein